MLLLRHRTLMLEVGPTGRRSCPATGNGRNGRATSFRQLRGSSLLSISLQAADSRRDERASARAGWPAECAGG